MFRTFKNFKPTYRRVVALHRFNGKVIGVSVSDAHFSLTAVARMEAVRKLPVEGEHDLALSMSGCGFLGMYHCGAIKCFIRHGQSVLARCKRFTGASAGALVAALVCCCQDSVESSANLAMSVAEHVRSLKYGLLSSSFSMSQRIYEEMNRLLPDDAHIIAEGKLFIAMTDKSTLSPKLESKFETREKLIRCLVASSHIPYFSGITKSAPEIDGKVYLDGGFSLNLPVFPDLRTVTISPFHSVDVDISPIDDQLYFDSCITLGRQRIQLSYNNIVRGKQALFPPPDAILNQYLQRGYIDTMLFLKKHNVFERLNGSVV